MRSPALRILLRPTVSISPARTRRFASSAPKKVENRVYNTPRSRDEFSTLLLLSTSSRRPLITLWTTSRCSSCAAVLPLLRRLIEEEQVGAGEGGIGFAEVEADALLLGSGAGLAVEYAINSIPTLLSFDKGEAQVETKVTDLKELKSEDFLRQWIQREAARQGHGGASGKFWGLFG